MHLPEQTESQSPCLTDPVVQPLDDRDVNQHFECVLALIVMASLTVIVTFERICALAIFTRPVSKLRNQENTAADDNTEHVTHHHQTRPPSLFPSPTADFNGSVRFMKNNEKDVSPSRTRGVQRGLLLWFGYTTFLTGDGDRDIKTDFEMLNKVFTDIGFTVLPHWDCGKKETIEIMSSISLEGYDCVFVVVSSHGYDREGMWDTAIRCSDGGFITTYEIVEYFSYLPGVPKVFIFQACRGTRMLPGLLDMATDRVSVSEDEPRPVGRRRANYSDILIAYSTPPGFVSPRSMAGEKGTWYMKALCKVFAAHAHQHDVIELFRLLGNELQRRCPSFTPVVEQWDFKSNLYLHQAQSTKDGSMSTQLAPRL